MEKANWVTLELLLGFLSRSPVKISYHLCTSKIFDISFQDDPYAEEPVRCILCPQKYSINVRPSWKNPKLLAQFVSPHTGLVYKKHITGLCEFMQREVEREVNLAQRMGEFEFEECDFSADLLPDQNKRLVAEIFALFH